MSQWYILYNGQSVGPMAKEAILSYNPNRDTLVWKEGMANWEPIYTVPELMELIQPTPQQCPAPYQSQQPYQQPYQQPQQPYQQPQQPYQQPQQPYQQPQGGYQMPPQAPVNSYSSKDKTTAGILAILLGSLGIQYFYIGKTAGGFLTILLTLVTCGIWPILTFIQGIMMLTMTQEEFNRKYVFNNKTLPLF